MTADAPRITVRAISDRPMFGVGDFFTAARAWAIYVDRNRTAYRVVDHPTGLTIIDAERRMVTSWHAGIGPGDLARLLAAGKFGRLPGIGGGAA